MAPELTLVGDICVGALAVVAWRCRGAWPSPMPKLAEELAAAGAPYALREKLLLRCSEGRGLEGLSGDCCGSVAGLLRAGDIGAWKMPSSKPVPLPVAKDGAPAGLLPIAFRLEKVEAALLAAEMIL